MKKSLEMSDFSTLENGDSMDDVKKIDPIAALYRKGYDTLSDELIHKARLRSQNGTESKNISFTYSHSSNPPSSSASSCRLWTFSFLYAFLR